MEHIDSLHLSSQHCVWNKSMQNDLHIERWKSCSCLCTLTSVSSRGWNSHIEDSAIPSSHTSESQPLSIYGATQLVRTNGIGARNGLPQERHNSNPEGLSFGGAPLALRLKTVPLDKTCLSHCEMGDIKVNWKHDCAFIVGPDGGLVVSQHSSHRIVHPKTNIVIIYSPSFHSILVSFLSFFCRTRKNIFCRTFYSFVRTVKVNGVQMFQTSKRM